MQKLAIFLYSMGSGGAERVVSNLLPFLVDKFDVHLILMSDIISYKIPKNVTIHLLENSNPYENKFKKAFRLAFALPILALKYKFLCKKLDISTHFVLMNRPCYIALMARKLGLKGRMVISERSCPSIIYKSGISGFFNRLFIRFLYNKADLILANAKGNADDLIINFNIDSKKIKILPNALNLDEISRAKDEPFTDEFVPFFINIGRLDSGKNQAMLINIIAKLDDKRATLGILGKGVLKDELENLIQKLNLKDRVRLFGTTDNPFKFIKNAKCLVCASRFEGFSNVLLEALACQKFIISTDHKSGARELLGDDEWGILVPVDDETAMLNAMKRALDEADLIETYEKKSYQRALQFDSKIVADKLINLLS